MQLWILHSKPLASVRVNEMRSEFFKIVTAVELFLCSVRSNPDITGYIKPSGNHKIAATVDNLTFYVTNLSTTLPNILRALRTYGELSIRNKSC